MREFYKIVNEEARLVEFEDLKKGDIIQIFDDGHIHEWGGASTFRVKEDYNPKFSHGVLVDNISD